MQNKNIFQPADILLPKFSSDSERMKKWAVIACDQFTSELSYWNDCIKEINGEPSALDYILPEAYLETEREAVHAKEISENMAKFDASEMKCVKGFIYVERRLPKGKIRHGLVGKIDLEAYSYEKNSTSQVRATEETVVSRIPPRRKIREEAVIELPHILVLINDSVGIFKYLKDNKGSFNTVYDFDLLKGGGHITGYEISGEAVSATENVIADYERKYAGLTYATGDGNHSLAAAKAHWENVKKATGDMNHPARYALCEIEAVEDDALEFEPIYRILMNCDTEAVLCELEKITSTMPRNDYKQKVTAVYQGNKKDMWFTSPTHALTVGTLQDFIDEYKTKHPEIVCDYIHGEESVEKLSREKGSLGFLMDGMGKEELFPYVEAHGTLPRKTFSMGEAESKRYYLELRKITY